MRKKTKKQTKKESKSKVEKKKVGRPTKLTEDFINIFKEIMEDGINSIIFTDEELRDIINDKLEPEERISTARWEAWKAGELKNSDELMEEFRGVYKKALQSQKKSLFDSLKSDEKAWQRFAWIIERKFDNWNIRNKQEITGKDGKDLKINLIDTFNGDNNSV